MKIEAVITCVRYSDFLAHTLAFTTKHFEHLVVVTAPDDLATQRVCEFHDVHCIPTPVFQEGGSFVKGKAINVGLQALSMSDWVAHLDADIVLPPHTRRVLERSQLDPKCLFGIDRMNCPSYEDWVKFFSQPQPQYEQDSLLHLGPFPLGCRFLRSPFNGYVPLGFFQLWNPGGSGVESYPDEHPTAAGGDVDFATNWPRSRRILFPEIVAFHLESGPSIMGANWEGRTTPPFGPAPTPRPSPSPPPAPVDPPNPAPAPVSPVRPEPKPEPLIAPTPPEPKPAPPVSPYHAPDQPPNVKKPLGAWARLLKWLKEN